MASYKLNIKLILCHTMCFISYQLRLQGGEGSVNSLSCGDKFHCQILVLQEQKFLVVFLQVV